MKRLEKITLDAEAGQVSAELVRRGVPAATRVHVVVEVVQEQKIVQWPIWRRQVVPLTGWQRSQTSMPMPT
ncbi:MAG TPA: hypothetical protein VJ779_14615 [Acetobacteraceae bacterium]|nr:hypothetical protein [Acetobacteraceae bacterium]